MFFLFLPRVSAPWLSAGISQKAVGPRPIVYTRIVYPVHTQGGDSGSACRSTPLEVGGMAQLKRVREGEPD